MANHFRPGTPLFIRVLSSCSPRAITAYVLFTRFTFNCVFEPNGISGKGEHFRTRFLILGAVEGSKVNMNLFGAGYSYDSLALQNLTNLVWPIKGNVVESKENT